MAKAGQPDSQRAAPPACLAIVEPRKGSQTALQSLFHQEFNFPPCEGGAPHFLPARVMGGGAGSIPKAAGAVSSPQRAGDSYGADTQQRVTTTLGVKQMQWDTA